MKREAELTKDIVGVYKGLQQQSNFKDIPATQLMDIATQIVTTAQLDSSLAGIENNLTFIQNLLHDHF